MNDFYSLLGEEGVMFFPTGYKRSVQFGQEDASGVVQRTAALNALRGFEGKRHLVVCTYPELWPRRWPMRESSAGGR